MRLLVCLALVLSVAFVATPRDAHAGSPAPLARLDAAQAAALDAVAGAGVASAPALTLPARARIVVRAPGAVSFGFQGRTPATLARITPDVIEPPVFEGFGGFACQPGSCCDDGDCCDDEIVEGDVLEGKVDRCGRVYTETVPSEVNHRSSYYVPRYRNYVRSSCSTSCDPCTTTRRYVVVRRPVVRSCYRPCYRTCYSPCWSSCYSPCYRGCGWGPFWGGFGWGLGWGVGIGLASGCW